MSRDAAAGALNFAGPVRMCSRAGLLSVFPLTNTMPFPDSDRQSRNEREIDARSDGGRRFGGKHEDRPSGSSHGTPGEQVAGTTHDTGFSLYPTAPAAVSQPTAPGAYAPSADPAAAAVSPVEQDRAAVASALQGNQLAFADLVNRYQSAVFNMAYRMLGDPVEAEDAAQEVFVRAWNQLHTFQMDKRFSTWLLSIASHYCIDMLRRRKPTAPLDDVALYVESDEPEPEEVAMHGEQRDIVQRLLSGLPEKYRSVTVLRYFNDLSYDEIARVTGLTESAVKTQLHRARRMLAELITAKGGAPDGLQDLR